MTIDNILKIEKNAINNIFEILDGQGVRGKIIFITESFIDGLYGKVVRDQLERLGVVKNEFVDYNTISYSMSVAERVIATDVDYIVGLGGGKVLDVCKYAAYISKRPFISIPTTMANDGLASPIAVLKRKDDKPKSLGCAMPTIIIIDTVLITDGPVQLIKAGIGDTISNYMALKDWEVAVERGKDQMNGFAYIMSKNALDGLMRTKYTTICPEFIDVLANSLVLSGIAMNFAGSSRPVSGSEHLFSHALDYYCEKKNLHGIQVALGTVAVLKILNMDYSEVLDYLRRFEVDINPTNLGIKKEDFVLCMQKATSMRHNRYTYLHETDLNAELLEKIYDDLVKEL
jgi:glycerol-1-phosphate dehydrogenase [NAD(P)+]